MSLKGRFNHTKTLLNETQNSLDESLAKVCKENEYKLNVQIIAQLLENERKYWKDLIIILNTERKQNKKTRKFYSYERPW